MAKITDYSKVTTVDAANVFLLDGTNGTKGILANKLAQGLMKLLNTSDIMNQITLSNLSKASDIKRTSKVLIETTRGSEYEEIYELWFKFLDVTYNHRAKRMFWRGRNIGDHVTDEQYAAIKAGTFEGLFIGDYWSIGDVTWRIVDFDYWYGTGGDNACNTHHVVIMPDENILGTTVQMNTTDDTSSGYVGSSFRSGFGGGARWDALIKARAAFSTPFIGGVVPANSTGRTPQLLSHEEYLVNAATDGQPTGGAFITTDLELPSESMMYGSKIMSAMKAAGNAVRNETVSTVQLAAMAINPSLIRNTWLRDIVSPKSFARITGNRQATASTASTSHVIRPVFGLVGGTNTWVDDGSRPK